MVNTEDFIKRLEIILDYYSLNASGFADKIGVQRSSLSHLLSGRNKPSLDFILKILEVFPEVDLYWILNGKGFFPKNDEVTFEKTRTSTVPSIEKNSEVENLFTESKSIKVAAMFERQSPPTSPQLQSSMEGEIEKIVVFYKNGTFKSYVP